MPVSPKRATARRMALMSFIFVYTCSNQDTMSARSLIAKPSRAAALTLRERALVVKLGWVGVFEIWW